MEADAGWSNESHHLAFIHDSLEWANWQRGGGEGERPTPMMRPAERRKKREAEDAKFKRLEAFEQRRKRREEARARQLNMPD